MPGEIKKRECRDERLRSECAVTLERRYGPTCVGEVSLPQFEFLDLEGAPDELLGLITTDSDFTSNFFVSLDAEGADGVLGLGLDGLLVGEIFKHLSGLSEFIARLTGTKVQDELVNLDSSHLVVLLLRVFLLVHIFFLNQLNLLIITSLRLISIKNNLFDTNTLFTVPHSKIKNHNLIINLLFKDSHNFIIIINHALD